MDGVVRILSPKAACKRKAYRFAYDAIDNTRTRKKRTGLGGTADKHLSERNLYRLREICRDMGRNNPLIKGLLLLERHTVVGSGVKIQARTEDDELNKDLEAAWKEQMLQRPCDVTGRYNFDKYIGIKFFSYRRDGDVATVFTDDLLQGIEGQQIGTPWGKAEAKYFDVVNGIAFSKETGRLLGYYIGKQDKWGYIKIANYKKYPAEFVHHMFDPEQFSQSRGEPILTSSINFIDTLCDYIDAELVAAKVNACFSMFVSQEYSDIPEPFAQGISDTGEDEFGHKLEKLEPGTIMYGSPGETAAGIGQTRPGALFDPFVRRMLTFIGRPLCLPLMLITLDFQGATFMNARIAYQKAQEEWQRQQNVIIKPFVSKVWRWKLQRLLDTKQLKTQNDKIFRHEVICNRWPYVDPFKEARADEQQLKNGTTTRALICARQGLDFDDVTEQLAKEKEKRDEKGLKEEKKPMAGR